MSSRGFAERAEESEPGLAAFIVVMFIIRGRSFCLLRTGRSGRLQVTNPVTMVTAGRSSDAVPHIFVLRFYDKTACHTRCSVVSGREEGQTQQLVILWQLVTL